MRLVFLFFFAHVTSSLMKHRTEANILHTWLLSSPSRSALSLIVNLRRYDTKLWLARPRRRVIEFGCAIFLRTRCPRGSDDVPSDGVRV